MTFARPFVRAFECSLSIDDLLKRLNEIGSWRWRLSDSDTYGESLWMMPDETCRLRISPEPGFWVLEVKYGDLPHEPIDQYVAGQLFPGIDARNIRPTKTVR